MGFIMLRVEVPGQTDTQLNAHLKDDAKAGLREIIDLLEGVSGGVVGAQIDVAVRSTTQAITAQGNGTTESWNLK